MKFDIQRFISQDRQSVHSGSTIFLKVNGMIIGRAQSLDGRRSFGTEGVYEIGSIMPQEHVNNRYEGTVSLERFLIRKTDLAKAGLAALGEEILTRDMIDIEVISKYEGQDNSPDPSLAIRVYRGCTCVDYSETFRVGAIAGENATFQYLSCDRGDNPNKTMHTTYNDAGDAYYNTTAQGRLNNTTNSQQQSWDTVIQRLEEQSGRIDIPTNGPENNTGYDYGRSQWVNATLDGGNGGWWDSTNERWTNYNGNKYWDFTSQTWKDV